MANGKWHYIESEPLQQTIAFDEISRWLFCKDGTKYSPQELAILTHNWTRGDITPPLAVHLIKKIIDGTITAIEEKH